MKQGVQLVLERVQRHRAFPRLAAANGQNLQPTLSPATNTLAPVATRLEPPRFVPVLAEPLRQNVAGLENIVPKLELQDEVNAVAEHTQLEVEAAFQTFLTDASQFDEQFTEQIFEQTSTLETSQRFEAEIVEAKTLSDSSAIQNQVDALPNQNALTQSTNLPKVGEQSESANDRSSNPSTVRQAYGVQPRAVSNQAMNQQSPLEATQPRETPTLRATPTPENSSVESLQTELATSALNLNLEQNVSFSEPNQNQDTTLMTEEITASAAKTFLETSNLILPEITQTVTAADESPLESLTPIQATAQPARSPSRLESTLEALRQFNPQTQNGETIIASQPTPQNSQNAKPSSLAPSEATSKVQPSAQKPPEPNRRQAQIENQNALEPKVIADAKLQFEASPQNPNTIQTALETQTPDRANPGLPTESVVTREAGVDVVQTEQVKTQNADTQVAQAQLNSVASEQTVEEQIKVSELQQNQTATPQTRLTQTDQTQTPLIATPQMQLPQVSSSQPESKNETSNFDTASQRPSEDTREIAQNSSVAVTPTVQAPLSEEARERAAYQRAVTMRAERAKRALAAKEELERDPTLEVEINQAPTNRTSEPPKVAVPDLTPPLETQQEIKVMPSIETLAEIELESQNPQIQNLEISGSSQTVTRDLGVTVESNSSESFANNVEPEKAIVRARTPELLSETQTIDSSTPQASRSSNEPQALTSSEVQVANSSQLKTASSSELQTPNSSETQIKNLDQPSNELQTPNSSETQNEGLNQSWVENAAEIQSNQNSSHVQNSNLAENSSQIATANSDQSAISNSSQAVRPNSIQAVTMPSPDVPASFLNNTQGVSVYNPQRRIQRATPTPVPKPKHQPNEAEKLFDQMPGMSQQEVLNVIRKAQGLPPLPSASQVQNPDQANPQALQSPQATNNPNQKTRQLTEQNVESDNPSFNTAALSPNNTDARVEQNSGEAAVQSLNTSGLNLNDTPNGETSPNNLAPNQSAQVAQDPSVGSEPAKQNAIDANGNKVHIFNPPNRRVLAPKPKVEVPKTEAQKLFEAMEVTETADELFQRVVKNRLKPNADTEPEERVQDSEVTFQKTTSSLETPLPSAGQALLPNLASRNALNSSDQPANVSLTGNERLQFSGSERVQLSQNATRFLKPIVGIDPNDVKLYRDPQTERLTKAARADALTVGDTVLLSNEQALESPETLGLIAHELTHVARNRQARFVPPVARGNSSLAASAQSGNEEGLALGVEAFARQGWNNFNQNTPTQNLSSPNFLSQNHRSQTSSSNTETNRSSYGGLPAPSDLPTWFIEDRMPPQATSRPAPRAANVARSAPSESSFVPQQAPTNQMAASMGAQAASQERDLPTPPPAAGPLPASPTPKPEPIPNRAAPDLDAMARQVYTILKRRLANERHRM